MINIKINMMIKIMMVALMFSHPCWPQPYETRIAIIHVVRRHRRRMIRRPRRGRTIIQVTIGVTSCLAASASCWHSAFTSIPLPPPPSWRWMGGVRFLLA